MNNKELHQEIRRLCAEKNAVIMAHYYTRPEIQDAADFIGDSLALARKAAETEARVIVMCGVHFMAETCKAALPRQDGALPRPPGRLLAGRLVPGRRALRSSSGSTRATPW